MMWEASCRNWKPKRVSPEFRAIGLILLAALVPLLGCSREAEPPREPEAALEALDADPAEDITGPLRRGIPLPSVILTGLDGAESDIRDLVRDRSLIFFISTSCEVCKAFVADWRGYAPHLPPDLHLVAVVDESLEFGRAWAEENDFPFPLYLDTRSVFSQEWGMDAFPTVAGVTPEKWIAFARRGIAPDYFTPARAETLLARGSRLLEP